MNILTKTIKLTASRPDSIVLLSLNRPKVANALNPEMIDEMIEKLNEIKKMDFCRALLIFGKGKNFCAGADLTWMEKSRNLSSSENEKDVLRLVELFEAIYRFPAPTIVITKGAVYGGAVGLVACCDITIAEKNSIFSMSEIRIGLVPAVIMPYLVRKINAGKLRWYSLSGKTFSAEEAKNCGLIEIVCNKEDINLVIKKELKEILLCAPYAQKTLKNLYQDILDNSMKQSMQTAKTLSQLRVGKEAQDGLRAFLDKSETPWSINLDEELSFEEDF